MFGRSDEELLGIEISELYVVCAVVTVRSMRFHELLS